VHRHRRPGEPGGRGRPLSGVVVSASSTALTIGVPALTRWARRAPGRTATS